MTLQIEACFGDVEGDTYVSMGEILSGSDWAPEFVLAGEWVRVEFRESGATLRVKGDELQVLSDGAWHEGKLLGVVVRARLH